MQRLSLREAAKTQSVVDVVSVDRQSVCVKVHVLVVDAVVEKLNRNCHKTSSTVRILKQCKRYCD